MTHKTNQIEIMPALARAAGGVLALATAVALSSAFYPKGLIAQADGWAILATAALLINGIGAARRLGAAVESGRGVNRLDHLVDAALPFLAACALTVILTTRFDDTGYNYLFGVWLTGCGLINLSLRKVMPVGIRFVGLYYMACGIVLTLVTAGSFLNPWPMAAILFVGESGAAIAMLRAEKTVPALSVQ